MFTFQSTYRSFDLNYGKKVISFKNYVYSTSDVPTAEFLRRHAAVNKSDVWELGITPTPEAISEQTENKPKRGRPPGVKMVREARTVEVQEQKE